MPRRSTLSATEREQLLALPESSEEFIRQYTFSKANLSLIHQHRGAANRLGFAVQLCYLRFPGVVLGLEEVPAPSLLAFVATQLKLPVLKWAVYGEHQKVWGSWGIKRLSNCWRNIYFHHLIRLPHTF